MTEEGYKPSEEEMKNAEGMMTDIEAKASEERERLLGDHELVSAIEFKISRLQKSALSFVDECERKESNFFSFTREQRIMGELTDYYKVYNNYNYQEVLSGLNSPSIIKIKKELNNPDDYASLSFEEDTPESSSVLTESLQSRIDVFNFDPEAANYIKESLRKKDKPGYIQKVSIIDKREVEESFAPTTIMRDPGYYNVAKEFSDCWVRVTADWNSVDDDDIEVSHHVDVIGKSEDVNQAKAEWIKANRDYFNSGVFYSELFDRLLHNPELIGPRYSDYRSNYK